MNPCEFISSFNDYHGPSYVKLEGSIYFAGLFIQKLNEIRRVQGGMALDTGGDKQMR